MDDTEPITVVGVSVTNSKAGGLIVSVVVALTVPTVPVIVVWVWLATAVVLTVKVTEASPAGMLTLAGVVADLTDDDSLTTTPPFGAALVNVTVPVEPTPPATVDGLTPTERRLAVSIVS